MRRMRNSVWGTVLVVTLTLGLDASTARCSPSACVHIEQRFLGANGEKYFYFETIRRYTTSYYEHTELLRVCARRKSDAALVDSVLVSEVRYSRDPSTHQELPPESRPLPAFDFVAYVRQNAIHLAAERDLGQPTAVDSVGVHYVGAKPTYFIRSPEIQRQLPDWYGREKATVSSSHQVWAPWNRDNEGVFRKEEWYFLVDVGSAGGDTNWGRFVVHADRTVPAPPPSVRPPHR